MDPGEDAPMSIFLLDYYFCFAYFLSGSIIMSICFLCCLSLTELNECDPNPCLNNGMCVDGVQNYTCNCASFDDVEKFYTGRNCGTGEGRFGCTYTWSL